MIRQYSNFGQDSSGSSSLSCPHPGFIVARINLVKRRTIGVCPQDTACYNLYFAPCIWTAILGGRSDKIKYNWKKSLIVNQEKKLWRERRDWVKGWETSLLQFFRNIFPKKVNFRFYNLSNLVRHDLDRLGSVRFDILRFSNL